jgi:EAL domain-containing protein (putative c-di-GMP-specific phosphodiesterase class I)
MANELGLEVITEGVEYSEQAEFLKSIGCKTVQGYLYCKPIELKEFEKKVLKY